MISAAMPMVLFSKNPAYQPLLTALSRKAPQNIGSTGTHDTLEKAFKLLPSRQTEYGHYGIWNNVEEGNLFVTAYVAHFLIEARERHLVLPKAWFGQHGLFNNTISALEEQSVPQEGDSLATLRQRAYSAYLLTRLAKVPPMPYCRFVLSSSNNLVQKSGKRHCFCMVGSGLSHAKTRQ